MNAKFLLTLLFPLILFAGNVSQTAEIGPGYPYWSTYKPGTMVSFRCLTTGSGADQTIIRTFTLNSVNPDVVLADWREFPAQAAGAAPAKPSQSALGMRLEFRASASPKENEDNFKKMLVTNIENLLNDPDKIVERTENVIVKGRPIRASRMRILNEASAVRTEFTLWTNPEIPGRLVRLVREIRAGSTTIRDEVVVVDFLAFPATPEEVAGLRAAHKPSLIEITGLGFVENETRCLEDMKSFVKEIPGFETALSRIVPGSSDSDWNGLHKQFSLIKEKAGNLTHNLEEDRPKAEAKLAELERQKLRPFFESVGRYIDQFMKQLDLMAMVLSLVDNPDKIGSLTALLEEMRALAQEYRSAYARFQDEFKKLIPMRLQYLR